MTTQLHVEATSADAGKNASAQIPPNIKMEVIGLTQHLCCPTAAVALENGELLIHVTERPTGHHVAKAAALIAAFDGKPVVLVRDQRKQLVVVSGNPKFLSEVCGSAHSLLKGLARRHDRIQLALIPHVPDVNVSSSLKGGKKTRK